jgi:Flp pilus assembly protein TadG
MPRKGLQPGWLRAATGFRAATSGNVAISFAVAFLLLLLATLGVAQYALALSIRTKLNAVADAAALQAVSSPAITAYLNTGTTDVTQATSMFNAQAATVKGVTISALNIGVVATAGISLTATVSYTATLPSIAPGILGNNFTQVSGTSVASSSSPAYINFYLLLDASPSMGIGSTPQNIAAMQTETGCGFACHAPDALPIYYTGYKIPKTPIPNSMLRIGAVQSATTQLVQDLINYQAQQNVPNLYKVGVYSFANTVTTLSPLTANLTGIPAAIASLGLPNTDISTQIADAVDYLNTNVVTTSSGNGTQNSPYVYVFLVTDGVEDRLDAYVPGNYDNLISPVGTWNGSAVTSVMDTTPCTSLKAKATLAVLYTSYDPMTDLDGRYVDMVAPFQPNIGPTLQSCATSPNFFFQADSASDINTQLKNMLASAMQKSAHLTQ